MSDRVPEEKEFLLTIFGLNQALRTIVVSLCKLYRYRDRSYRVVPPATHRQADIVIVDADDEQAMEQWRAVDAEATSKPAVLIGADFAEPVDDATPGQYRLKRTRLSAHLLKTLDAITMRELKYVPELVIGEEAGRYDEGAMPAILDKSRLEETGDAGRVLVVDDSLSVRTQMNLCLRLHDLAVDLVEDAESALELLESKDYDVVFLDVVLPEMDGYKMCKLIKSNQSMRDTPVVMLTGKSSPFNKVRGVMAGCDRYLTKPVDSEELKTVLHEYIPELAVH